MSREPYLLNPILSLLILIAFAALMVALIVPAGVLGALAYVALAPYPVAATVIALSLGFSVYGVSLLGLKRLAARFEDRCVTQPLTAAERDRLFLSDIMTWSYLWSTLHSGRWGHSPYNGGSISHDDDE